MLPNVQAKAARAADEPANQHNARGARSLFGRKLGIVWPFSVLELSKLSPELVPYYSSVSPRGYFS
jgi:hypothetical protein